MHGKKGVRIVNGFEKILGSLQKKQNKTWVDQGSEFYKNALKFFLKDNHIKMFSTFNEEKHVVAERFIRTFKKIFLNIWQLFQKIFVFMF